MPKKKTETQQVNDFVEWLATLLLLVSFISFICYSWADKGAEGGWLGTAVTCLITGLIVGIVAAECTD